MKKITFLVSFLAIGFIAGAQSKPNMVRQPEVKTLKVSTEATVTGYESTLAPGRLSLAKTFTPSDGSAFEQNYTLRLYSDNSFNNRKPVKIGLSRKSFDSVFTRGSAEMAAKYPKLDKYVTDNKISLSDEKGWIAVVQYFNSL